MMLIPFWALSRRISLNTVISSTKADIEHPQHSKIRSFLNFLIDLDYLNETYDTVGFHLEVKQERSHSIRKRELKHTRHTKTKYRQSSIEALSLGCKKLNKPPTPWFDRAFTNTDGSGSISCIQPTKEASQLAFFQYWCVLNIWQFQSLGFV